MIAISFPKSACRLYLHQLRPTLLRQPGLHTFISKVFFSPRLLCFKISLAIKSSTNCVRSLEHGKLPVSGWSVSATKLVIIKARCCLQLCHHHHHHHYSFIRDWHKSVTHFITPSILRYTVLYFREMVRHFGCTAEFCHFIKPTAQMVLARNALAMI